MSAFVVSNPCIVRIVRFLTKCVNSTGMDRSIADPVRALQYNLPDDERKLANDMLAMNNDAVNQRYRETGGETKIPQRDFSTSEKLNAVVVYKSLSCFIYQCSEGNVPERDLYKALEKVQTRLADYIVSELPEYDAAPWGN